MTKVPELKPTRGDALVAAAVLLLAAVCALRFWTPMAADAGAPEVVVAVGGEEVERLPLRGAERRYTNNGYTVHVVVTDSGVRVADADCPTRDCVRTGAISRAGQSIVCLPARITVTLVGGGGGGYDAVAG